MRYRIILGQVKLHNTEYFIQRWVFNTKEQAEKKLVEMGGIISKYEFMLIAKEIEGEPPKEHSK